MFRRIINYLRRNIIDNSGGGKAVIFLTALIFFFTRLTGDILLALLNRLGTNPAIIWKTVTAFSVIVTVISFLFNDFFKKNKIRSNVSENEFANDIIRLSVLSAIVLFVSSFLPDNLSSYVMANNIFILMLSDFLAFADIYVGLSSFYLIYKWLIYKRHKKTELQLSIVALGIISVSFVRFLVAAFYITFPESVYNFSYAFNLLLALYLFFSIKRIDWLALLPKKEKLKLLGTTIVGMVIFFMSFSNSLDTNDSLGRTLFLFLPGTHNMVGLSFLMTTVFLLRIFFALLMSLPTSKIMERRIFESHSLMHLNKVVAQAVGMDQLVSTVTRLALNAGGAIAARTEINDNGKKADFALSSSSKISQDTLNILHEDFTFNSLVNASDKPLLIESVKTFDSEVIGNNEIKKQIGSIIIIPLYSTGKKIGSLVALHTEEYGFEDSEVKVLEAFSDNINIALENARLLEDSIEKEKLKRELNLARDIQMKLLPAKLPKVKNFTLDAFTISAEEVGGDYYDIVFLKNGLPCVLIGDVSGKGMSAAFYMAQLKGVVLAVSEEATGAADILKRINTTLYGTMEKQMYITLSALVMDSEKGTISLARAGHMPSLVKVNGEIRLVTPNGMGIGLCDKSLFDNVIIEETIDFVPDGKCILYTDGVSELRNSENEELGIDFLKQILISTVYTDAGMIVTEIKNKINEYAGNIAPHDDMTIVAVTFLAE